MKIKVNYFAKLPPQVKTRVQYYEVDAEADQ